MPVAERPWKVNRGMADAAFMDEARGWDVNEVVFKEPMWCVTPPPRLLLLLLATPLLRLPQSSLC